MEKFIRFDWAMKRLLRDKANFGVLEGLLTTLLNEPVKIQKLLESESNQEDEYDSSRCRTTRSSPISSGCCSARRSS